MEFAELIKTPRVDNVVLRCHRMAPMEGTLVLTSHHIIFSTRSSQKDELMLLYTAVEDVEKKLSGSTGVITIICKNFLTYKLRIPGMEAAFNVAAAIESLSTLESAISYYPFFHRIDFKEEVDGWKLFNYQSEYKRLIGDSKLWKVASINSRYEVCQTYPSYVVVPSAASDEILVKSARFRANGRFPILAYLHKKNMVPLTRSSQPTQGQSNRRSKEDEKLLNFILTGHGKKGSIVDTRSNAVAQQQKTKGGGMETEHHYPQWKRTYANMNRPYTLTDSISKLMEACVDVKTSSWLQKLESSGWLTNVESLLWTVWNVVRSIDQEGVPVLVHGDSGTDCTLQVTSLAQVLLDPYCRTIKGFQSLMTREWLWGGYSFTERHWKVGLSSAKKKSCAPVFLLFLDCLNQVRRQYPTSFEFNESYLLLLAEHAYASEYGTFLFNSTLHREQAKVASKTVSLWSYINREEMLEKFRNPLYEVNQNVLWPSVAPQSLEVWQSLFLRWTLPKGIDSEESIMKVVNEAKNLNEQLKLQALQLQKEYSALRQKVIDKRNAQEAGTS